jgi:hypothetical protein
MCADRLALRVFASPFRHSRNKQDLQMRADRARGELSWGGWLFSTETQWLLVAPL